MVYNCLGPDALHNGQEFEGGSRREDEVLKIEFW